MGKTMSSKQRLQLMSVFMLNADFDDVPSDVAQLIIDNPVEAGRQFTFYLKNGGRVSIGDMKIAPVPFDSVKFIGSDWKVIAEDHDACNDGLAEVDFNKVDFAICLKEGETSITGEEKLKRLKALKQILYGATTFMGLWNDYHARKENSVLETLYRTKGITYLDFFGDVLLDPNGNRFVLCLCRNDDGQWHWRYDWLGIRWNAKNGSAVSSQVGA